MAKSLITTSSVVCWAEAGVFVAAGGSVARAVAGAGDVADACGTSVAVGMLEVAVAGAFVGCAVAAFVAGFVAVALLLPPPPPPQAASSDASNPMSSAPAKILRLCFRDMRPPQ
jgi:hypothetical protein